MDETEIEEWYEEKKQKITQEYQDMLNKGKDREKARSVFSEKLNKLVKKYEKLQTKHMESKNRETTHGLFFDKIKNRLSFLRYFKRKGEKKSL